MFPQDVGGNVSRHYSGKHFPVEVLREMFPRDSLGNISRDGLRGNSRREFVSGKRFPMGNLRFPKFWGEKSRESPRTGGQFPWESPLSHSRGSPGNWIPKAAGAGSHSRRFRGFAFPLGIGFGDFPRATPGNISQRTPGKHFPEQPPGNVSPNILGKQLIKSEYLGN